MYKDEVFKKINNDDIYLYAHVPFCAKRCSFCYLTVDFSNEDLFSWKRNSQLYVDTILKEIESFDGSNYTCQGISFGGGTPTLLENNKLEKIVNSLKSKCKPSKKGRTINIEVYPGSKSLEELKELREMGFNRVNLGAQSFDDIELKKLGRHHKKEVIYETYEDLRKAGFENINIDLMFGLPTGDFSLWKNSVDLALDLEPEHFTAYYWFLTEGSSLFKQIKQKKIHLPVYDEIIKQYEYAIDKSIGKGFDLYWDYNFSKENQYEYNIERDIFRMSPIRGFGPDAWSNWGKNQIRNHNDLNHYLENPHHKQIIKYTPEDYFHRSMMYPQGLVFSEFEKWYGKDWDFNYLGDLSMNYIDEWENSGLLVIDKQSMRFDIKKRAQGGILLMDLINSSEFDSLYE